MILKILKYNKKYWLFSTIRWIFENIWFKYRYYYYKTFYKWGYYWKNIKICKYVQIKWNVKNIYIIMPLLMIIQN